MRSLLLILLTSCGFIIKTYGQADELNNLIKECYTNSPTARLMDQNKRVQQALQSRKFAPFKPTLSLSSNIPGFSRSISSITQPDGSLQFRTQSQAFSSLSLMGSQNIPLTGGRVSVNAGLSRIDLFYPTRTVAWSSNLFIVTYSQPLFQFNEMKYLKSNIAFSKQVDEAMNAKQDGFFEEQVSTLLLDYFSSLHRLKRLEELLVKQDDRVSITKNLIANGKGIAEDLDIILIKKKELEIEWEEVQIDISTMEEQVNYHFKDTSVRRRVESFRIEAWNRIIPDRDSLLSKIENEAEWLRQFQAIESARQNLERQKANSGLSMNLDISFGLNQRADVFQDIFRDPLDRQMGSISMSIPILDGGNSKYNREFAKTNLDLAIIQLEIIEYSLNQKVNSVIRQFEKNEKRIVMLRESVVLAEKRSNRLQQMYMVGRVSIDMVLDAEMQLEKTEVDLMRSYVDYWKLYYSVWL